MTRNYSFMTVKTVNILHVEDDEVDAMVMKRALKKTNLDFTYHHAKNGIDALDMLKGTNGYEKLSPRPSVILLDLNMPQMNGHEFLRELRSDADLKPISVYVLSTSGDDKDREEAFEKNVAGYILKPLTLGEYVEAINTLNNFWQLTELP
jgi:CheY-like chemotaxis protein